MSSNINAVHKWDYLVRLCHWLMVGLVGFCWYSAENGLMQWHYYSGYALIAVVVIRIVWGFVGRPEAKFSSFIKSPKTVFSYLSNIKQANQKVSHVTHSPAGGYSVVALLLLLLTQTTTGLFSVETDGWDGGPLSEYIDYDLAVEISELHQLSFDILLGFIVLHILAVVFYQRVLKRKLLQKMSPF